MSEHVRFQLKTVDDLKAELDRLGLSLPISDDFSVFGQTVDVSGRTLPNRFLVQPMEGVDSTDDGSPRDLTYRRYRRFAEGGAGLLWFEAVAVVNEGRSNPRQLYLHEGNLDDYKKLADETHDAGQKACGHSPMLIVQLTHSGRFSKPTGAPKPVIAQHNPELDSAVGIDENYAPVTDDELDRLQDDFVKTAKLLYQAGFDGVDMKAVHGYLIAELLGCHTREGKYGGSFENRTRFVREVIAKMRQELPESFIITSRFTAHEPSPWPYGWGINEANEFCLDEPLRVVKELGLPTLNFSIGYPRFQPYMNRPHDNPLVGAPKPPEHPLEGVVRFQNVAKAFHDMSGGSSPVMTAALSWLRHLMPYVAAGMIKEGWTDMIGIGRLGFAYPGLVRDLLEKGSMDPSKCCTTCSMCSQIMKDVVGFNGCVVRDREIYVPQYKAGRDAAKAKGLA